MNPESKYIDVVKEGIIDVTDLINSKKGIYIEKGYHLKFTPENQVIVEKDEDRPSHFILPGPQTRKGGN